MEGLLLDNVTWLLSTAGFAVFYVWNCRQMIRENRIAMEAQSREFRAALDTKLDKTDCLHQMDNVVREAECEARRQRLQDYIGTRSPKAHVHPAGGEAIEIAGG